MTTPEDTGMEQWDLTSSISPYLDRHMMFPLLEYLDTLIDAGTMQYSQKDVAAARLSLLRPTHMVDYAIDIYKGINGEPVPKEMEEQKKQVYQRLEELRAGCKSLDELCNNKEERVSTGCRVVVCVCVMLYITQPIPSTRIYSLSTGKTDGQWRVELCGSLHEA